MSLQDHFHPPLSLRRQWQSFHHTWATSIAADLNQRLPEEYIAEPSVQFGIEADGPLPIDVATLGEAEAIGAATAAGGAARTATAAWTAPAPTRTVPLVLQTDTVEVLVFREEGGLVLAGAIELVSPANKDRPAHRDAFLSKCATYLQQGVGLVIVDVVTERSANLHVEFLARLGVTEAISPGSELYATAYRPIGRTDDAQMEIWEESLALGRSLPTLPLWLRGGVTVPVDLDATYHRACRELRIPIPAGTP
jgi:hypothetical protein